MTSTYRRIRRVGLSLVAGTLLALPVASPLAQIASAAGGPCDPPNFCGSQTIVPFDGPNGPSSPQKPIQQAPANPQPASSVSANPARASSQSVGSGSASLSLNVTPSSAAPGAPIVVSGSGFSTGGHIDNVFLNVRDANGTGFDTRSKEIKCVETDDVVVVFLQNFGIGCSADAGGPIVHTDSNGNFRAAVTVPSGIAPGAGKVCANSPAVYESCAPFTISGSPAAQPQLNAPAQAPDVTAAIQKTIQSFDDAQTQAIAAQDPSLMANVAATSDVSQMAVEATQDNLDAGVVDAQLQNLQWGPIKVAGSTAQATDTESWTVALSDGSTQTQSNTWVYSLALDNNGIWEIQSIATR